MTRKKKKSRFVRRLPLIAIFLLLVTGISFFMYPILSNWITENSAHAVIREYDSTVQQMGSDSIDRFIREANDYNRSIAKKEPQKVSKLNYNDMLAVTDAIAYIEIPKIGVYYPIYRGLSDDVLQKGVGHMEGTSLPVGGKDTHCVLAGHTGLPSSKLFTDLDTLTIGDVFYIHVLDRVLKYKIDQIQTVLPYQAESIAIEDGSDLVTLVTCTPYGINDHRLLVRGSRVDGDTVTMEEAPYWPVYHKEETTVPTRTIIWYAATTVIAVVVVGILVILLFPVFKKKKRRKPAALPDENTTKTDLSSEDLEE